MSTKADFILPTTIASIRDLQAVIQELQQLEQWTMQQTVRTTIQIKRRSKIVEPQLSDMAKQALHNWQQKHDLTPRSLQQLTRELETQRLHAKTITIILAAPVTQPLREKLIAWCRESISPQIFVNFEFNRSLLGGMVVRTGSKIHNWSFRSQILASSGAFPEILRHV